MLISFLLAAVIVLLVAACFTELAARLHKTGSTYLYLYLTVGELPAALLGYSFLLGSKALIDYLHRYTCFEVDKKAVYN